MTSLMNGRYQMELVYADAAGQIFMQNFEREVVSQLLIPKNLQLQSSETSDSTITSSSPQSLHAEVECFEDATDDLSSRERAFRAEMVANDLRPFRSREPIIDLKVNVEYHGAQPVGTAGDGSKSICIHTIDLIHAHSITRIGYLAGESYVSKGWVVPQVVHITTILTLPKTVTIASCEFFPGVPRGPYVEVGPLIFSQHGSNHIYLARPNSNQPPTILVHAKELKAVMPPATSTNDDDDDSPPLLCRAELKWVQKDGSPGHHPLLVMFHGYVFRVGFNPAKLTWTRSKLQLVIGNSPHLPSNLLAPFFRRHAQEYCLQEMNRHIFILDRVEGYVSQFTRDGDLKQCLEPSPPSGLRWQTPFLDFFVQDPYNVPMNIYLIDSAGEAIYHWTCDHFKQGRYGLDGRPCSSALRTHFKPPKPLRPAILLPPTELKPAIPLVYTIAKGWHPYTPPLATAVLQRVGEVGRKLRERWMTSTSHVRFLMCCFCVPFVLAYLYFKLNPPYRL